jgi:Ca-activated chloride channel family protein
MNWAQPEHIIWILCLPIFLGLSYYVYRWRLQTRAAFADSKLIKKLFPDTSNSRYWTKIFLISAGILFAVIALMDPLYGEEEIKVKREGVDVIYALDLSNSMNTADAVPSRLERAKKIISESVNRLGGDRVGLIVFAADAYSISPLTNDYSAIQSYISSASPALISQQGTSFSNVLNKAAEMFGNAPTTGKLLVILSDGEDNEGSVSEAEKMAKENNIHILSIGIGTSSGGPIPMHLGGFQEYKLDKNGEIVISKLEESSLKSLAKASGGQYILAHQTEETLKQLHTYLNSLDKIVQDTAMSQDKKHVYQWILAISLLLIFIDTLTTEHKLFNNKKG